MVTNQGLYWQDKDETGLTKRQREVLQGLREGLNQLQVGEKLGISRQRVRQIVETLLDKKIELPGVKKPEPGSWSAKN